MAELPGVGKTAVTGTAPTSGEPVRPARIPRVYELVRTPDGPGRVRNTVRKGREVVSLLVELDVDRDAGRIAWREYALDQLEYSDK